MDSGNTVVVGFDGTAGADSVLRWAARETLLRQDRLVVLRCQRDPAITAYERGISDLTTEFRELRICVETRPTNPGESLVVAAREASLVVVGAPGADSGLGRLISASTALHVAVHATSPVAVVPRTQAPTDSGIVAAVDGSGGADRTLEIAFEEAGRRRLGLRVVRIKETAAAPALDALERDLITVDLRPWCARYPEVAVTPGILHGPAPQALAQASHEAALLVVGARRRAGYLGLRDASMTPKLLQRAGCPILIAR